MMSVMTGATAAIVLLRRKPLRIFMFHTMTSSQITEGNGQGFRDLFLSNAVAK